MNIRNHCIIVMTHANPLHEIGKITIIGAAFACIGALGHVYVLPFRRATEWLTQGLAGTHEKLANTPVLSVVFKDNPITGSPTMQQFLAINTLETGVFAGVGAVGGAAMKAAGVKPSHVEDLLNSRQKSETPDTPSH